MQKYIQKKIEELHMISSGDKILVAVSGGADSVCLLFVLYTLREELDFVLEVIHVEHGIRGAESVLDARYVQSLCQQLRVPIHTISVNVPKYCEDTGLGTEEAARVLRYQAFAELAKSQNAKVALAHHMEDNAETILFQMIRGSSLTGLCGMRPIRESEDGVIYIRPLLYCHRQEIEQFLKERNIAYQTDSTNMQLDYSRNFIRNKIMPDLEMLNTQAVAHMNHSAMQLAEVRDYMEHEVNRHWNDVIVEQSVESKQLVLNVSKLLQLHITLQKEVVYKAIGQMLGSRKDVAMVHVMDILKLCQNQSGRCIHLPQGLQARKEYEKVRLYFSQTQDSTWSDDFQKKENWNYISAEQLEKWYQKNEEILWEIGTRGEKLGIRTFPYNGKSVEISQKRYTKWLDYDKIKDGFCIRTRRSGDAFIGDALGHRKKLKQYFIDEKIPASQRDEMWLLAHQEIVLWLIGGRISEHVKVTENTNTIIEITYYGGE